MEHTKGKWEIQRDGNGVADYIYCEDTTQWICNIKRTPLAPPKEEIERREANARRIVHCCNNFDALVEALEYALTAIALSHTIRKELKRVLNSIKNEHSAG